MTYPGSDEEIYGIETDPAGFLSTFLGGLQTHWSNAKGLQNYDTLVKSGNSYALQSAYEQAGMRLQDALARGDVEGITFWGGQVDSIEAQLSTTTGGGSSGGGGGGGDSLASIYNAAVNTGAMKSDAASKALDQALKQASLTTDRTHMPGFEPFGALSGQLSGGMMGGLLGGPDAGKYEKVDVPGYSTITKAANDGFNSALSALMGAYGGGGGGSGSPAKVLAPLGLPGSTTPAAADTQTPPVAAPLNPFQTVEGQGVIVDPFYKPEPDIYPFIPSTKIMSADMYERLYGKPEPYNPKAPKKKKGPGPELYNPRAPKE